jgi:hypothetical protein
MAFRLSPFGGALAAGYATGAVLLRGEDTLGIASFFVTFPWSLAAVALPEWAFDTWAWDWLFPPAAIGANAAILYLLGGGWRRSPAVRRGPD